MEKEHHKAMLQKQREQVEEARKKGVQEFAKHTAEKKRKKLFYVSLGMIALLALVSGIGYAYYLKQQPGQYDDFAKCLTVKGAVMYGAIEWCQYTQKQAGMFGNSFKYVSYKDYKELEGIKKTPTWVINGQRYENVQSFEKLAALTGCSMT